MKYKKGLLIGRFQPLHYGHIYLFSEALKQVQTIIVGIGSSQKHQVHTSENPFPYELRKTMLQEMIKSERMSERIESIIPLVDYPNDDVWREQVLKQTGAIDIVISNNDWVNGIFKLVNIPSITVPLYKRELYEGKKIREILKVSEHHEEYMPKYIRELIATHSSPSLSS